MKRIVASAAIAALVATPALAEKAKPLTPAVSRIAPVPFTWTGFYVGGNLGADWEHASVTSNAISCSILGCGTGIGHLGSAQLAAQAAAGTGSNTQWGGTAGGQVGFNWQTDWAVLGIEADIAAISGIPSIGGSVGLASVTVSNVNSARAEWLSTVRSRLGVAVDRSLFYVTGGVAFTEIKFAQTVSDTSVGFFPTPPTTLSVSQTKTGYALGGGAEYAIKDNWLLRAEYLYAGGFGSLGGSFLATSGSGNSDFHSATAKLSVQMFRVGASYKFN